MDFKDYIQGKRHGKEANKLEKEALNDAFLQDAIDGYDAVQGEHLPVIEELGSKITTPQITRKTTPVWRWVAAVIAFLLVGSSTLYFINKSNKTPQQQTATVIHPTKIEKNKTNKIDSIIESNTGNNVTQKTNIVIAQNKSVSSVKDNKDISQADKIADSSHDVEVITSSAPQSNTFTNATMTFENKDMGLNVSPFDTIDNLSKSIKTASIDNALQGRVAGLDVRSSKNHSSNIRIRGTSSINKSNYTPVKNVSGKITDENGEPLIGATVAVKGKKFGTVTDMDGNFNLQVPSSDSLLVASYIGYENTTVPAMQNMGDIKLLADNKSLSEVVVVGYGVQKKRGITGSISQKRYKQPFTQKNFIEYFKEHYNKDICQGKKIEIEAKVEIDEKGAPSLSEIIKSNCPEMKEELNRWLSKSPQWSIKNKTVILKIEL